MDIDPTIIEEVSGFENSASFIRSARYGYNSINSYVAGLKENSNILEVGGGACILAAQLSKKYPLLRFYTIEPHAEGFQSFNKISHFLAKKYNFNVYFGDFSSFSTTENKKFDLIFTIDVLEHLPNYEYFLKWSKDHLNNSGNLVTVFPNFRFPFDYHFRIPILLNKKITGFIFQHKIRRHEINNNCEGLWSSLNFIKVKELKELLDRLGFIVRHSTFAFDYILEQINSDRALVRRVGILGTIAKFAYDVGALKIFRSKILQNWIPFAILEATIKDSELGAEKIPGNFD